MNGLKYKPTQGSSSGSDRNQGAAGGRRPFRPPDPTMEPQDAPLHLRRARWELHHRPPSDPGSPGGRTPVRLGRVAPRRNRAVRRNQEAGARHDPRERGGRRHALRQPPLARRSADELPDDLAADKAAARPRALRDRGPASAAAHARADGRPGGPREAAREPRWRQEHAAVARRGVRDRPEDRGDRGARGSAPSHPDHRARRHELRPRRDRLRGSRQRRRNPLVRADHAGGRRRREPGPQRLPRGGGASPARA